MKDRLKCRDCTNSLPLDSFYEQPGGNGRRSKICKQCHIARGKARRDRVISIREQRGGPKRPPGPSPRKKSGPGGLTGNERHAYWTEFKRERGCKDCATGTGTLEFDHLPGHVKLFDIGNAYRRTGSVSDQEIRDEVAKCDVVCRECHAKRTSARNLMKA